MGGNNEIRKNCAFGRDSVCEICFDEIQYGTLQHYGDIERQYKEFLKAW